ncbi:hypothetical protein DN402_05985 [Streptomyces sp. SW4]|nr:hypothetical protein DN402_05985 [Streptomyces sp. SW4]
MRRAAAALSLRAATALSLRAAAAVSVRAGVTGGVRRGAGGAGGGRGRAARQEQDGQGAGERQAHHGQGPHGHVVAVRDDQVRLAGLTAGHRGRWVTGRVPEGDPARAGRIARFEHGRAPRQRRRLLRRHPLHASRLSLPWFRPAAARQAAPADAGTPRR